MKKLNIYALCALAAAALAVPAQARPAVSHQEVVIEEGQTFEGDIVADKAITVKGVVNGSVAALEEAPVTVTGVVNGDVSAVGGAVAVPGAVRGDVSSVGGSVDVTGKVSGDVSSVGGKVTLSGSGEVDGDISSFGGTVITGDKAVHKGSVNNMNLGSLRRNISRAVRASRYAENKNEVPGWVAGGLAGLALMAFFSALVTGVILMLLPPVFFPKNVEAAHAAMKADMWRCCGIGAIIVVCIFPGLLLMLVSILGIPLIPFALILLAAAGLLGLAAFSVLLQDRFFAGIKRGGPQGLLGKVAAGYGLVAGLLFLGHLVPIVGGILSLIGLMLGSFGAMVGLGAAWTTRMGTRPAPVQPAPAVQPVQPPAAQ